MNSRGLVHHVAIGENQAVGSEHETGAAALPLAGLAGAAFARLRDINLDYGRAELLGGAHDRLRVGIEQGGIVQRASARKSGPLVRNNSQQKRELLLGSCLLDERKNVWDSAHVAQASCHPERRIASYAANRTNGRPFSCCSVAGLGGEAYRLKVFVER